MKKTRTLMLFAALLFLVVPGQGAPEEAAAPKPFLGFGDYRFKIASCREVPEVKTRDGVVRSENRQSHLLEVLLRGTVPSRGLSILNPSGFSAVFLYRGQYRMVASRAVGGKPELAPGVTTEVIISHPQANMNCDNSKGGTTEEIYLYFDLPREAESFRVLVPHLLEEAAKGF